MALQYKDYADARDAAWRALIEAGIRYLPVNLRQITDFYGIKLRSYSDMEGVFDRKSLTGDGFTVIINNVRMILYNDLVNSIGRRRFTVAHEIGHNILGHKIAGLLARSEERNEEERQANQFARDLLMPAIVLYRIGVMDWSTISQICGVSTKAAKIMANEFIVLLYLNDWGKSPMERAIERQFCRYILSKE